MGHPSVSDYERVTVRVDRELYERMLARCDEDDRTISSLLRHAITVYFRSLDDVR